MFSFRKLCMFYIIGSLLDAPTRKEERLQAKTKGRKIPHGHDTVIANMEAHRLRTTRTLEPHGAPQASETAITGPSRHAIPACLQIVALSFSMLQRAAMSVIFYVCPSSPPSCLLRPRGCKFLIISLLNIRVMREACSVHHLDVTYRHSTARSDMLLQK